MLTVLYTQCEPTRIVNQRWHYTTCIVDEQFRLLSVLGLLNVQEAQSELPCCVSEQVTTLDNWSCLIIDLTITEPACLSSVSVFASDCGFPVVGLVYMLISVCLTTYIFANLFIAQILDTITFGLLSEDAVLTPTNLVSFKKLWAEDDFDPK